MKLGRQVMSAISKANKDARATDKSLNKIKRYIKLKAKAAGVKVKVDIYSRSEATKKECEKEKEKLEKLMSDLDDMNIDTRNLTEEDRTDLYRLTHSEEEMARDEAEKRSKELDKVWWKGYVGGAVVGVASKSIVDTYTDYKDRRRKVKRVLEANRRMPL